MYKHGAKIKAILGLINFLDMLEVKYEFDYKDHGNVYVVQGYSLYCTKASSGHDFKVMRYEVPTEPLTAMA